MKQLLIATGIMLAAVSAFAFGFGGGGGGGGGARGTASITGGTINGASIGATNPSTGKFSQLEVAQRAYSSHSITMYAPDINDPAGARPVTWTVAPGNDRAGFVKYSSGSLLVDGVPAGTGAGTSGGSSFKTATRSVLTNMSSNNTTYFADGFGKHTLPLAAGNQSVRVYANNTSAWISAKTESGVIIHVGGITTTAGYTARLPKDSLYEFISDAANSTWRAFKLAGENLTQYIADFIASLGWTPTSKDYGSVVAGSEVYQKYTLTNSGNAASSGQSVAFLNQSSCFRSYSSTCGSSLSAGANCTIGVAFKPSGAGTWGGTKLRATADGIGPYDVALLGVGTAADTTPSAFTFTDEIDIAVSTAKVSNTITVAGIDAAAAISVTGDAGYGYKKNGAACTATSGTVVLNDTVNACVTSSGSNSTATAATVTIGGVSDTYTVTTSAAACGGTGGYGDTETGTGSSVAIGDGAPDAQYASSWTATTSYSVYSMELKVKRINTPTGVNLRGKIYADNAGVPGTMLAQTTDTYDAATLGTVLTDFTLHFDPNNPPAVTSGTLYWIAIEAENFIGASAYVSSAMNQNAAADRNRKQGTAGDTGISWTGGQTTDSLYFKLVKCQ